MITSTILTLFVVPTIYVWFSDASERFRARRARAHGTRPRFAPAPAHEGGNGGQFRGAP
jgi:hypothetical protein